MNGSIEQIAGVNKKNSNVCGLSLCKNDGDDVKRLQLCHIHPLPQGITLQTIAEAISSKKIENRKVKPK